MLGAYIGTIIITSTADLKLKVFGLQMVNKQYINLLQFALVIALSFYVYAVYKRGRVKSEGAAAGEAEKKVPTGTAV
jgi:hypothetical protein